MRYFMTIYFWAVFISFGVLLTFGKPLGWQTTGFISFVLGVFLMGMFGELDDRRNRKKKGKA